MKINVATSLADVTLMDTADGLVIGFNDDEEITLAGITAAVISEDGFVF